MIKIALQIPEKLNKNVCLIDYSSLNIMITNICKYVIQNVQIYPRSNLLQIGQSVLNRKQTMNKLTRLQNMHSLAYASYQVKEPERCELQMVWKAARVGKGDQK